MIDLFSQTDLYEASQISDNHKINLKNAAEYLGMHADRPQALDQIMKVALRLDSFPDASVEFVNQILFSLREFQTNNESKLPFTDT